jgi:hypothetical protein
MLSLVRTLRAGLDQLPHLLPKGDANRDGKLLKCHTCDATNWAGVTIAALDIARNLGQIARDNWQNAHHGKSVHGVFFP